MSHAFYLRGEGVLFYMPVFGEEVEHAAVFNLHTGDISGGKQFFPGLSWPSGKYLLKLMTEGIVVLLPGIGGDKAGIIQQVLSAQGST
jgi:hypothetical protein